MNKKNARFWLIIAICALSFLIVTVIGLNLFWDYMAAFEASRPQNAIDRYMAGVTAQSISALPDVLPQGYDTNLQSEEAARKAIADSIGSITYARNTKLTTDSKMVYMVLSGGRTLGSVTMTVVSTDSYGFSYWDVTDWQYDFSHLVGQAESITVPEGYPVYANGVALDESYITESDIRYDSIKEFYSQYDLPALCTYTAGPVLGPITVTVTKPDGTAVQIGEDTDLEQFLNNCTQQELDDVQKFLENFVQKYTDFTSVTGGKGYMQRNYNALVKLMVSGGKLAQRMQEAMAGLTWVTDRNAKVSSVTLDRCLRLEEGRYLCDFTYVVDTRDFEGKKESTSSVRMIVVETQNGLRAESMTSK